MFSGNFGNGLWIAFIGWFLETAASSQLHQQTIHDLLDGHRVVDTMRRITPRFCLILRWTN